jgi:hypothetical protein
MTTILTSLFTAGGASYVLDSLRNRNKDRREMARSLENDAHKELEESLNKHFDDFCSYQKSMRSEADWLTGEDYIDATMYMLGLCDSFAETMAMNDAYIDPSLKALAKEFNEQIRIKTHLYGKGRTLVDNAERQDLVKTYSKFQHAYKRWLAKWL